MNFTNMVRINLCCCKILQVMLLGGLCQLFVAVLHYICNNNNFLLYARLHVN